MSNTNFLRIDLENVSAAHSGYISIALPAEAEYLRKVLDVLDISKPGDLRISDIRSPHGEYAMTRMLEETLKHAPPPEALEELNYLAVKLAGMTDEERKIFQTALEITQCAGLAESVNIAENLGKFELQPFRSAEQYGKHLLKKDRKQFDDICQRMLFSKNPDEVMFANHFANIQDCVDYAAYGHLVANIEDGLFTRLGYMATPDRLPKIYRGTQDIPEAYRMSPAGDDLISSSPTNCLNGTLEAGDLILSAPYSGVSCLTDMELPSTSEEVYALLVGTVTGFRQSILPGKEHPTHNAVIDFTTPEYSEERRIEVTRRLGEYYGRPLAPGEWPPFDVDCAEMALSGLARITGIDPVTLQSVLDSEKAADSLYRLIQMKHEKALAATPEKPSAKGNMKPSLMETLERNAQKSREHFGDPTPSTEKKKGDPSL